MITATVFVHGYKHQINWSDWEFLQLPAPGDTIGLTGFDGYIHYAKVRHTEHLPKFAHRDGKPATAIVVTDWVESFAAAG